MVCSLVVESSIPPVVARNRAKNKSDGDVVSKVVVGDESCWALRMVSFTAWTKLTDNSSFATLKVIQHSRGMVKRIVLAGIDDVSTIHSRSFSFRIKWG